MRLPPSDKLLDEYLESLRFPGLTASFAPGLKEDQPDEVVERRA